MKRNWRDMAQFNQEQWTTQNECISSNENESPPESDTRSSLFFLSSIRTKTQCSKDMFLSIGDETSTSGSNLILTLSLILILLI